MEASKQQETKNISARLFHCFMITVETKSVSYHEMLGFFSKLAKCSKCMTWHNSTFVHFPANQIYRFGLVEITRFSL